MRALYCMSRRWICMIRASIFDTLEDNGRNLKGRFGWGDTIRCNGSRFDNKTIQNDTLKFMAHRWPVMVLRLTYGWRSCRNIICYWCVGGHSDDSLDCVSCARVCFAHTWEATSASEHSIPGTEFGLQLWSRYCGDILITARNFMIRRCVRRLLEMCGNGFQYSQSLPFPQVPFHSRNLHIWKTDHIPVLLPITHSHSLPFPFPPIPIRASTFRLIAGYN